MGSDVAVASGGFLASPTVQTALILGGFVAAVTGIVGVFTVVRGQSFAGHALADLGSVGGAGAFLVSINQVWGFVGAGIIAALLMELIGVQRLKGRDVTTGVVLSLGMGVTALFLYWDTTIGSSSNAAVSVLFGSLFVVNPAVIGPVIGLSIASLVLIVAAYRWLLMSSLDADLATARGVPVRLTGIMFLIALALAVELSSLTIGAILSTALLIGPAATALLLTRRFGLAALLSAAIAVATTWVGVWVSYESYNWGGPTNWPVSFCIVALIFLTYLAVRIGAHIHSRRLKPATEASAAPAVAKDAGRHVAEVMG